MKSRKSGNGNEQQGPFSRPACPPAAARPRTVMNIPFDHLYASDIRYHATDRPQQLRYLGNAAPDVPIINPITEKTLTERLNQCSKENRMLKNLLLVNLDLVQQQSDRIASKEEAIAAFRKENTVLRLRIDRYNRGVALQRAILNPPPLVPVNVATPPPPPSQSKHAGKPPTAQVALNKYSELLITDNSSTTAHQDTNLNKSNGVGYYPDEAELLHLPDSVASLVKEELEESIDQNHILLPDNGDFIKTEMNSMLDANEPRFAKPKRRFYSGDDEFLLPEIDVTSVENESDVTKSENLSARKGRLEYSNVPEMTAADRLKETICRQKLGSEGEKQVAVKKETQATGRASSSSRSHSRSQYGRSQRSKSQTNKKDTISTKLSTTRTKNETITYSQFYKSRNALKAEPALSDASTEAAKPFDTNFRVNKKSKMIHTYSKSSKSSVRAAPYAGSLSDRLKLIDTTPTGEDPYQLGEADMREQSPIPKLMLQKNHPNKAKLFSGDNYTCSSEAMKSLFDPSVIGENEDGKVITKIKLNKYNTTQNEISEKDDRSTIDIPTDLIDSEPSIKDESMDTSCCDFSYGENSQMLSLHPLESTDRSELFSSPSTHYPPDTMNQDLNPLFNDTILEDQNMLSITTHSKVETVMSSRSLLKPNASTSADIPKIKTTKDKSKRTFSTCSSQNSKSDVGDCSSDVALNVLVETKKRTKSAPTATITRPPRKRQASATIPSGGIKKITYPPITVREPYHTTLGDAESSWYLGPELDADERAVTTDEARESKQESVEVPRWREKVYTGCYSMEGTENLDDEIFHKRHHKRELDEKRRKRWDIQGIREQLVVERLRRKQRDAPWYNRPTAETEVQPPYTLLAQPRRDLQFIEVVDEIPVSAFGENIPAIPEGDFYLPWVRSSKPQRKKMKRVKKERAVSTEEEKREPIQLNAEAKCLGARKVRRPPQLRHKLHKLAKFRAMLNSARVHSTPKI